MERKHIEILYKRQKNIIEEKKREDARIYFGREKEISLIEQKFLLPRSKTKPVLNIHGPDSIGKSRLLKQFREHQESNFIPKYVAYIDFFMNYRLRNKRVSFLSKIINEWDPSHSLFNHFRSNNIKLKNIVHSRSENFKSLCQKEEVLRKSEALTSNRIINVKLLDELIRHNLETEEVEFILNYTAKQEEAFFREVENIYHHERGRRYENIIILDDLDSCSSSVVSLVKKIVKRLGNKVFFLIATREPILWNKETDECGDLSSYIEYMPLEKLKTDNIVNYLTKKEIHDESLQDVIIDVSCGFPFIMETMVNAIDLMKKNNLTISNKELVDFFTPPDLKHDKTISEKDLLTPDENVPNEFHMATFLMEKINDIFTFQDRRLKDVIYRISVPRYFNEEVVFIISENDDEKIADFFVNLVSMSFIYPGYIEDGDWKYHNLIRNVCLKLCEKDFEKDIEIHGKLYHYFQKEYPLEAIYHLYQLKPLESMGKIIDIFNDSLQSLRMQRASDILNDFFSYFTEISQSTEAEEKGLIYTSMANMFMNLPGYGRRDNIENTIVAYNTALEIYDEKKNAASYGSILKRLGDAHVELYIVATNKTASEKYLKDALEFYFKALNVFTKEVFPKEYADIRQRQGLVLIKFKDSDKEKIIEAIDYFGEALKIYEEKNLRLDFVKAKSELGDAYLKLADKEDRTANLKKALGFYKEALLIYKEEAMLVKLAEMWKNVGITYYNIEENKSQNLISAIDALIEALNVFSRDKFPREFIEIKKYIGMAYYFQKTGDISHNIEKSLACFKEALDVLDKENNMEEYAQLNIHLANAYTRLRLGDRVQNLEQSLALYSEALKILQNKSELKTSEIYNNQGMV
ncbi:MAG: ATP-binding protein, partial [Candidatus Firestonebacteria bacterium]|nr:ATP-binding protein [Candidatus Firestonebacteria bacterium]